MALVVEWVDTAGVPTVLGNVEATRGAHMPESRVTIREVPGEQGGFVDQARDLPRTVIVRFRIVSADLFTAPDKEAQIAALAAKLHTLSGDGRLRFTEGSRVREIFCRYVDGFTLDDEAPNTIRAALRVIAADPYFYDVADTSIGPFTLAAPSGTFLGASFFPLTLANTGLFAEATIVNTGQVEAWPVWTVTGPGDDLILRDVASGRSTALDFVLAVGDQVEIDTRPGHKTVTRNDGSELSQFLVDPPDLWPLPVGATPVQFELVSTDANTRIEGRYKRRHLTPYAE